MDHLPRDLVGLVVDFTGYGGLLHEALPAQFPPRDVSRTNSFIFEYDAAASKLAENLAWHARTHAMTYPSWETIVLEGPVHAIDKLLANFSGAPARNIKALRERAAVTGQTRVLAACLDALPTPDLNEIRTLFGDAATNGSRGVVELMKKRGLRPGRCLVSPYANSAARRGELDMLIVLDALEPFSSQMFEQILRFGACHGRIAVMKWARANGARGYSSALSWTTTFNKASRLLIKWGAQY